MGEGTLARAALFSGAAPRDGGARPRGRWTPGRQPTSRSCGGMNGLERLEFPIGTVLYQTNGYISHIRFSHDGQRIAFVDHPLYADDNGDVAVVDRAGAKTTLASGYQGAARRGWSPRRS